MVSVISPSLFSAIISLKYLLTFVSPAKYRWRMPVSMSVLEVGVFMVDFFLAFFSEVAYHLEEEVAVFGVYAEELV